MMPIPINNNKRNPLLNWEIHPGRNWKVNPEKNWKINPTRNWDINPKRNWQINPQRNWQINPKRNWQINPQRNWQINPQRNWQINPQKNYVIDPFRSNDILGYFVCSVENCDCCYFTVHANTQGLMLIFDANKELYCFAVGALNTFAVFSSSDLSYLGFLCSNETGGFNWFTKEGLWNWFLT